MANSGQKVVLITGCSSGIGLRIAVTLAKDEKKRYHGKKMRFLLHCFFNRSLSATDSTVRHREPVSVFTFSCEDASIAPELFYAQSSVEFHALRL